MAGVTQIVVIWFLHHVVQVFSASIFKIIKFG